MLMLILPEILRQYFLADFLQNLLKSFIGRKGDDNLENQMDNGSSGKNQPNESRQDARLKQLKFEVAQEMGIKPKAKNKKN